MNTFARHFGIILFLFIILNNKLFSDDLENARRSVVKIEVNNKIGAGIITSIQDYEIFIITAYHVIEGQQNSIRVYFRNYDKYYKAELINYNEDFDLAVITVMNDKSSQDIKSICFDDPNKVKEDDKIWSIGHPANSEWHTEPGSILNLDKKYKYKFKFSGEKFGDGNSGGALINKKMRLIGLITNKLQGETLALNRLAIEYFLNKWHVPFRKSCKCSPLNWIIPTVAAFTAYLIYINLPGEIDISAEIN